MKYADMYIDMYKLQHMYMLHAHAHGHGLVEHVKSSRR